MSGVELYNFLERMVRAADEGDRDSVLATNRMFSTLLSQTYRHLPDWSMNKEVLLYDGVRNRAVDAVTNWTMRETIVTEMRERFSQVRKPKNI